MSELKDLTGCTIEGPDGIGKPIVTPDSTDHEIVKMMKVIQIVRKPGGRMARLALTNSAGKLFDMVIDEATAKALSNIFDEDDALLRKSPASPT
jgi:hypothetical protein